MRHKPEHGFTFSAEPPYEISSSKYLSASELLSVKRLEEALEIYWNGKKARLTLKYVTSNYGIFDFLTGLGRHFKLKNPDLNYSLTDIFDVLWEYVHLHFRHDQVLKELVGLDYYLHFKVKPALRYLTSPVKSEKITVVNPETEKPEQLRALIFSTAFDLAAFTSSNTVVRGHYQVTIYYNGREKAKILPDTQFQSALSE
jgi:hypothetical protein